MDLAPSETFDFKKGNGSVLLIACGALGREIVALIEANRWQHFDVTCLPAKWHNTPDLIPDGVRQKIREGKGRYDRIFVLYGDCGTGGTLDTVLEEEGAERIGGPHCYSFFTGNDLFAERHDDDMTAFFLTDYLARQFDKLIWEGLGMDRHPELRDMYFGNYEKVVYLAQIEDPELERKARAAAQKLGLAYEYRKTGFGDLEEFMRQRAVSDAPAG
jgi:hypothetical protein